MQKSNKIFSDLSLLFGLIDQCALPSISLHCSKQTLMASDKSLTHWGRVTHICVSNLAIIGSDNGLSPARCQAIIWTNAGISLIRPLGLQWNFNSNWSIFIQENAFENIVCEMASILSLPQCVNTLRPTQTGCHFADNIFECIFLDENFWILNKI